MVIRPGFSLNICVSLLMENWTRIWSPNFWFSSFSVYGVLCHGNNLQMAFCRWKDFLVMVGQTGQGNLWENLKVWRNRFNCLSSFLPLPLFIYFFFCLYFSFIKICYNFFICSNMQFTKNNFIYFGQGYNIVIFIGQFC